MLGPLRTVTPVLVIAAVATAAIGVGAHSLSLATDLGRADQDVCDALDAYGTLAVQRLDESGFPHASTSKTEVYRIVSGGETKLALRIHWHNQTAECLPPTYSGAATATLSLSDAAYGALLTELRNVLTDGELSARGLPNWWAIWWGSNITIHGNEAYGSAYERQVAVWGAGWLVDHGGA